MTGSRQGDLTSIGPIITALLHIILVDLDTGPGSMGQERPRLFDGPRSSRPVRYGVFLQDLPIPEELKTGRASIAGA